MDSMTQDAAVFFERHKDAYRLFELFEGEAGEVPRHSGQGAQGSIPSHLTLDLAARYSPQMSGCVAYKLVARHIDWK